VGELLSKLDSMAEPKSELVSLRVTPTEKRRMAEVRKFAQAHGYPNVTEAMLLRVAYESVLDGFEAEMASASTDHPEA
jgi:hypothetical protein